MKGQSTDGPTLAAGLFFRLPLRSHTGMDPDLDTVIREALEGARASGKDYLTQTEEAVRAVRQVRPDMTPSAALTAVEVVRRAQSYRR